MAIERANPADLRKCLEAADTMIKAGLQFVPMPVLDAEDRRKLIDQMQARLATLIEEAERDE